MSTQPEPAPTPDGEPADADASEAFAGLTGIDVVDGELIPSERTAPPTQEL
ncbi:hypothetical protein ACIQLJ_01060 [Microbacterium sp. NPDC091313]